MNIEEYKKAIFELNEKAKKERDVLDRLFVSSNNIVKVGDTIEDHCEAIIVDSIGFYGFSHLPQCAYSGTVLTKKMKPFKINKTSTIYQSNLKKINGVEI